MFPSTNRASGRTLARLLLPAAGCLVLAAAGWTALATPSSTRRDRADVSTSPLFASTDPRLTPIRLRWCPGQETRYRLRSASQVILEPVGVPADGANPHTLECADSDGFALEADLVLRVLRVEGEAASLSGRLEQVSAHRRRGDNLMEDADLSGVVDGLQVDWVATITSRGEVRSVEFPECTEPSSRNRLRAVISTLQFVLPEQASRAWQGREEDLFGRFEANYAVKDTETRDVVEIIRRRRCVEAHATTGAPTSHVPSLATDGETRVTFDTRAGVMRTLSGRETIAISGSELPIRATCSVERSLVLIESSVVSAPTAPATRVRWVRGDGLASERVEHSKPATAEGTVLPGEAARSFDAVFDDALRVSQVEDWESAAIPVWDELAETFRRDPASVARAAQALASRQPLDPRTSGLLISALGRAGTAGAQAALLHALRRDELAPELRALALYAAVEVEAPTEESIQGFLGLAEDAGRSGPLGESILTGLGIAASKRMESGDQETADALVSRIERALERPSDPSLRLGAIQGLGNAGSTSSLPALLRETRSEEEQVREAAAFALRKMPREEAVSRLEELLTLDPAEDVRIAALGALATAPGPVEDRAMARGLHSSAPESVRRAALAHLSDPLVYEEASSQMREFRAALLRQVADSDPSEEVRGVAREALIALSEAR